MKRRGFLKALVFAGCCALVPFGIGSQTPQKRKTTLTVHLTDPSADFARIQDAIDAAQDGDTILIGPGDYRESIMVYKNVTIVGSGIGCTHILGAV